MSIKKRAVRVYELPKEVNAAVEEAFLVDLRQHIETERPRFVLDCSQIAAMDAAMMHLLLSCLEEAMKLNGDVRLAALDAQAEDELSRAGVDRLFETFATPEIAIESYYLRPTSEAPRSSASARYRRTREHAA